MRRGPSRVTCALRAPLDRGSRPLRRPAVGRRAVRRRLDGNLRVRLAARRQRQPSESVRGRAAARVRAVGIPPVGRRGDRNTTGVLAVVPDRRHDRNGAQRSVDPPRVLRAAGRLSDPARSPFGRSRDRGDIPALGDGIRRRPGCRWLEVGSVSSTTPTTAQFLAGTLTAAGYRNWLAENGVEYVALPDTGSTPRRSSRRAFSNTASRTSSRFGKMRTGGSGASPGIGSRRRSGPPGRRSPPTASRSRSQGMAP